MEHESEMLPNKLCGVKTCLAHSPLAKRGDSVCEMVVVRAVHTTEVTKM